MKINKVTFWEDKIKYFRLSFTVNERTTLYFFGLFQGSYNSFREFIKSIFDQNEKLMNKKLINHECVYISDLDTAFLISA